jgi:hypothetical protein
MGFLMTDEKLREIHLRMMFPDTMKNIETALNRLCGPSFEFQYMPDYYQICLRCMRGENSSIHPSYSVLIVHKMRLAVLFWRMRPNPHLSQSHWININEITSSVFDCDLSDDDFSFLVASLVVEFNSLPMNALAMVAAAGENL